MNDAQVIADSILRVRRAGGSARLVAVSGIDHAGKTLWAQRIAHALRAQGSRVAAVSADDWYRPRDERAVTSEDFYRNGLRLDSLFSELLFPLRARGSIDVEVALVARGGRRECRHRYRFDRVDVVLVDGSFLLKRAYQSLFDLAVWVDATQTTALERAIACKELRHCGAALASTYREVYFPAHEMHLDIDDPQSATQLTIRNDHRLPPALKRVVGGVR